VIALNHHEKYNGTGYPGGLKEREIPLVARIVAVADVFDALVSERPYKKPWQLEEAFSFIKEQSGQHFDPQCVDAFFARLDEIKQIRTDLKDE
jgi:two-component system response regulator RpfG